MRFYETDLSYLVRTPKVILVETQKFSRFINKILLHTLKMFLKKLPTFGLKTFRKYLFF